MRIDEFDYLNRLREKDLAWQANCEERDRQIAMLAESLDYWKGQWRLMESANKKAEEEIAVLKTRCETYDRLLKKKHPNGANGCCCLFDDHENQIQWCKSHAELRDKIAALTDKLKRIEFDPRLFVQISSEKIKEYEVEK